MMGRGTAPERFDSRRAWVARASFPPEVARFNRASPGRWRFCACISHCMSRCKQRGKQVSDGAMQTGVRGGCQRDTMVGGALFGSNTSGWLHGLVEMKV